LQTFLLLATIVAAINSFLDSKGICGRVVPYRAIIRDGTAALGILYSFQEKTCQ
jgi:hypothetical protein